jgi:hypothetical protein
MKIEMFEPIFNAYMSEGRELTYREIVVKCNKELKAIKHRRKLLTTKRIMRLVRKIYSDRWHEIQPKPSIASASILDKMRMAATRN